MLRHRLFPLLLATLVALILLLSREHALLWDWSASGRNQLHERSREILSTLQDEVEIEVFMPDYPVQRAAIRELLEKYRRAHQDLRYRFIDPARQPERVRELGIARTPLLLARYRGRQQRLEKITEENLSNALARLSMESEGFIGAITGHGEARLHGEANFDLGDFGRLLESHGYRIVDLDLVTAQIPRNLDLLVLAAPASEFSAGERARLAAHLEAGGNLLWLAGGRVDEGLASLLELRFLPGVVVDAAAADLGIDQPTVAVARPASQSRITEELEGPVLMPRAKAVEYLGTAWQTTPLLRSSARSWNETGSLKGVIQRDPSAGEQRGPLDLALLLSRGEQWVAVVGNADFISNSFIGNGANQAFGLALVHWLGRNRHLVKIPPTAAPDQQLHWSADRSAAMAGLFLLLIPALLALAGFLIPWRRRRR